MSDIAGTYDSGHVGLTQQCIQSRVYIAGVLEAYLGFTRLIAA